MKYLEKAIYKLGNFLPYEPEELLVWYNGQGRQDVILEEADGYSYVLFGLPQLKKDGTLATIGDDYSIERLTLLVFDGDDVIADCSAFHMSLATFMKDSAVINYISYESDWSFLSAYTLCGTCLDQYPNPYDPQNKKKVTKAPTGEVLIFANAYVTIAYRRRHIFTIMMEMMREAALRFAKGSVSYYAVIPMDPDIPVYGPDATDEPYYYTFEQDEPKRMMNKAVLEQMGWNPVRLQELDTNENSSGVKLWFGLRSEVDTVIVTDQIA